jgi:hypothetical protein
MSDFISTFYSKGHFGYYLEHTIGPFFETMLFIITLLGIGWVVIDSIFNEGKFFFGGKYK